MAIKTITYDDVQSQGSGFKHEETTRNIVLHLLNEYGDPVRPDASHTWVAKVSDAQPNSGSWRDGLGYIAVRNAWNHVPYGTFK